MDQIVEEIPVEIRINYPGAFAAKLVRKAAGSPDADRNILLKAVDCAADCLAKLEAT